MTAIRQMKAPRNMSGVVGTILGLRDLRGRLSSQTITATSASAEGQPAIGEGHFNDILLHFQGFGV